MPFVPLPENQAYDLVVVGSGFGSLFFIDRWLKHRPADRVLVLEWGLHWDHAKQIEQNKNSAYAFNSTHSQPPGQKPWYYTIGFGGGTNCWWGQTPRFHPTDFKLASLYGVGRDWPISYDALEPYYVAAEERMSISGSKHMDRIMPRSAPFPQPPHNGSAIDKQMLAAQPDQHFIMPTARSRLQLETRSMCCSSARCGLCPVDAKFTADNGFQDLIASQQIDWVLEAEVRAFETSGGQITGVLFNRAGRLQMAKGHLIVLGANAIHSAAILLRSGIDHPLTGLGLHEQVGFGMEVFLDGIDNFGGSTVTTGLNFSLYDGKFRSEHGGALIYFENRWPYGLRTEFGRWRQILPLTITVEDLPNDRNRVTLDANGNAEVDHPAHSDYAKRGMHAAQDKLDGILAPLPVERIEFRHMRDSESHLQGTLRMGRNSSDSVVDTNQVHHKVRNLCVVGSAVFASCSSVNPSLTVAALSMRAADQLGSSLN